MSDCYSRGTAFGAGRRPWPAPWPLAVQVGMGESILILAFVVIVIAVRRSAVHLVGSLLVGLVDTLGPCSRACCARCFLRRWRRPGPALDFCPDLCPDGGHSLLAARGAVPGTAYTWDFTPPPPAAARRIRASGPGRVAVGDAFDRAGVHVSFASRVLIMALAATSLNLVIGFGGMVSFGHAAFRCRRLLCGRSGRVGSDRLACASRHWRGYAGVCRGDQPARVAFISS